MENCIFCKLANGKIPSYKVHENEKYVAFMDIFPPTFNGKVTMPVVLITPKKHIGSNVFEDTTDEEYIDILKYTRMIAKAIQKSIDPERVCLIFEGLEVNHLHPKLYPVFSDSYPNFLSTEKSQGNINIPADKEFLNETARKIRSKI